ncbi:DciA family protein [Uliginosibacterium sediminicola]|uniref:DciA family protein n=1 Tax=Uliginosibacterium sediminicola TaxID=2024550 RepID=A0ABU9YWU3_9RHOO
MAATPIHNLLGSTEALARLHDHAARLVRLQNAVERYLPDNMRGAVSVANCQDGILSLHVSTPALATRLKMSLESLRAQLMQNHEAILGIRVKVRVVHSSTREIPPTQRQIGAQGKAALAALGDALDAGSPLAQALRKLLKDTR